MNTCDLHPRAKPRRAIDVLLSQARGARAADPAEWRRQSCSVAAAINGCPRVVDAPENIRSIRCLAIEVHHLTPAAVGQDRKVNRTDLQRCRSLQSVRRAVLLQAVGRLRLAKREVVRSAQRALHQVAALVAAGGLLGRVIGRVSGILVRADTHILQVLGEGLGRPIDALKILEGRPRVAASRRFEPASVVWSLVKDTIDWAAARVVALAYRKVGKSASTSILDEVILVLVRADFLVLLWVRARVGILKQPPGELRDLGKWYRALRSGALLAAHCNRFRRHGKSRRDASADGDQHQL
mmetsp:Transcript_22046/g.73135  ORF Transcript_22046/g.73135 Transcript_22046/m.73135 type:complete len:297 (+) Transcript_22046:85-975(+)